MPPQSPALEDAGRPASQREQDGEMRSPVGGASRTFPAALSSFHVDPDVPAMHPDSLGIQQGINRDTMVDVS